MKRLLLSSFTLLFFCTNGSAHSSSIAPGIDVVLGTFSPNRQPDGNTVIFHAPDGLIVMDTGRHAEHTRQIVEFAEQAKLPIKAIINSYWHLDHIGGNPRIRAKYPGVLIYASGALEGAMRGFLADYRKYPDTAIQKAPDDPQAQGWRDELAIIMTAPQSYPDEIITKTETRTIAGRKLALHLEINTVTAGDVWVFDPPT